MKRIIRGIFLPLAMGLLAVPASAKIKRLTVLHVNDMHGVAMSRPDRKESERQVGGAAVLANFVKSYRKKKNPLLLLDAGDWFQGTPEGTLSGGRMMAEVMNALGFDATALGNHDYDLGQGALKDLISRIKAPVLGSNIYSVATGKHASYAKPWVIKKVGGMKIGIFGITTSKMRVLNFEKNIAGLDFRSEIETARETVAELKKRGADIIILLSHAGYEGGKRHENIVGDQSIAKAVDGIDLIVGSHTHTPIFKPKRVNGALIVQALAYLAYAGVVELEYDTKAKKVVSSRGRLVKLWIDEIGEDEAVRGIVKRYEDEIGRQLDEVIGESADTMYRAYKKEDQVGGWMADCMRKWAKTDVAIQNGGGVRANIEAGDLRLRDMFELMPFDNNIVTINMKGADLLKIFDHGVGPDQGMIELSGAKIKYDPKAEAGKRIKKAWIQGRKLDPDEVYSVTVPDFVAQGGSGYDFSAGMDTASTSILIRDVLTWCTRKYSPIHAKPADRVTVQ